MEGVKDASLSLNHQTYFQFCVSSRMNTDNNKNKCLFLIYKVKVSLRACRSHRRFGEEERRRKSQLAEPMPITLALQQNKSEEGKKERGRGRKKKEKRSDVIRQKSLTFSL